MGIVDILIAELEAALPEPLSDGTFSEHDALIAQGIYKAQEVIREQFAVAPSIETIKAVDKQIRRWGQTDCWQARAKDAYCAALGLPTYDEPSK